MPNKLKPSTKEYKRDPKGRMTQKWKWKHYTVSGATTEELQISYRSQPRKRSMVKKELDRRRVQIEG